DNPAGDKPCVINRGADIKKYTACFEADSLKVGPQSFINNRREIGKQLVRAYKLHKPCKSSFQSGLRRQLHAWIFQGCREGEMAGECGECKVDNGTNGLFIMM